MIDDFGKIWRDTTQKRAILEYLEARVLQHAGDDHDHEVEPPVPYLDPNLSLQATFQPATAGSPLSSLPQLSSRSGAHAKLYLDFNGAAAEHWGSYNTTTTRAFTLDSDATTFNQSEMDAITQIWARVSEKYSPFDIDVTTIDPGSYTDKNALRVVVGGNASWYGSGAGGVAYISSFGKWGDFDLNTAYVFSDLFGANIKGISEACAHEAGHAFGLDHQSSFDPVSHQKTVEYFSGDSNKAPIMGVSYYSTRGLWWSGTPSNGLVSVQDDLSIISSPANGFGYRDDDHGSVAGAADVLSQTNGTSISASGVIEQTSDVDVFSFSTGGGTVSFTVNVAQYGAMLDAKLVLMAADGTVITSADTTSLGESLSANLSAGSYRIAVMSHGSYGDIGQFSLSGNVPLASSVAAPTNLQTTTTAGGAVNITWSDNSDNEVGFRVERSSDGGATWDDIYVTDEDATQYLDETAVAGGTYKYRVVALGTGGQSANSNASVITLKAQSPTGLSAIASGWTITLNWLDTNGETSYRIERSTNGTDAWSAIGNVGANTLTYSDSNLSASTTYYYRLVAINNAGASEASDTSNAKTAPAVYAPTGALASIKGKTITVSWVDASTNESSFRVERTDDGGETWKVVKILGRNTKKYTDKSGTLGATYAYRAVAVNNAGEAASDTSGSVTVAPASPNINAQVFSGGVHVNWNDVAGGTTYRIERSGWSGPWSKVGEVDGDATSFDDASVAPGGKYKYRVRAVNEGGEALSKKTIKVKIAKSSLPSSVILSTQPTETMLMSQPSIDRSLFCGPMPDGELDQAA